MTYWQALREILGVVFAIGAMGSVVVAAVAPVMLFGAWGLIATVPVVILALAFINWREENSPTSY